MIPFFELNLVLKGLSDATFSRWEPDWLMLDQVIKTIRENSKLSLGTFQCSEVNNL